MVDLVVGGLSGVISRTLTAPLELYKIQRQNAFIPNSTIRDVLKKEGIQYLWKGNGTNCMRVFPQTAINYGVFEFCKQNMFEEIENEKIKNFLSGSVSGGISITCTYPLTERFIPRAKNEYIGICSFLSIKFFCLFYL